MRPALGILAGAAWLLLWAPLAAVLVQAFGPASEPSSGIGLQTFAELARTPQLRSAFRTSIELAAFATGAGLLLGVPAALGLTRGALPHQRALLALLLSPIALPGLVLGFGLLTSATLATGDPGIRGGVGLWALGFGHLLLTVPWVVRSVAVALDTVSPALEEEARGLGAGPVATLFLVTLPSARAGITTGAISAFLISFGNLALSVPLTDGSTMTAPPGILAATASGPHPAAAASSALLIGLAVFATILVERVGGFSGGPAAERQ